MQQYTFITRKGCEVYLNEDNFYSKFITKISDFTLIVSNEKTNEVICIFRINYKK